MTWTQVMPFNTALIVCGQTPNLGDISLAEYPWLANFLISTTYSDVNLALK
jgi:hypothetical protein